MRRCRACKAPRWGTDPCANADCSKNQTVTVKIRHIKTPHTLNVKHGFHADFGIHRLVDDYDAPIRARSWRTAS